MSNQKTPSPSPILNLSRKVRGPIRLQFHRTLRLMHRSWRTINQSSIFRTNSMSCKRSWKFPSNKSLSCHTIKTGLRQDKNEKKKNYQNVFVNTSPLTLNNPDSFQRTNGRDSCGMYLNTQGLRRSLTKMVWQQKECSQKKRNGLPVIWSTSNETTLTSSEWQLRLLPPWNKDKETVSKGFMKRLLLWQDWRAITCRKLQICSSNIAWSTLRPLVLTTSSSLRTMKTNFPTRTGTFFNKRTWTQSRNSSA